MSKPYCRSDTQVIARNLEYSYVSFGVIFNSTHNMVNACILQVVVIEVTHHYEFLFI
jgi:hypothetical protein